MAITAAEREALKKEATFIEKVDASVQTARPLAREFEAITPYTAESPADTEATAQLTLFKANRDQYEAREPGIRFPSFDGSPPVVTLQNEAKDVAMIGFQWDPANDATILRLWG